MTVQHTSAAQVLPAPGLIASLAQQARHQRVLVLGYGNPGRQDDGLGPAVATRIAQLGWPGVSAFDNYQLCIEDAMDVAAHDVVWFVDASKVERSPFAVRELIPAPSLEFTSHLVSPETIVAMARHYFAGKPQAFLLAIRGYEFEFIEGMTSRATENLGLATQMLIDRITALGVMS